MREGVNKDIITINLSMLHHPLAIFEIYVISKDANMNERNHFSESESRNNKCRKQQGNKNSKLSKYQTYFSRC